MRVVIIFFFAMLPFVGFVQLPSCLQPGCLTDSTGYCDPNPPFSPGCCTTYWNGEPFSAPALDSANGDWQYMDCLGNMHQGGLYEGTNTMPKSHFKAGEKLAKKIYPINSFGKRDSACGKIVIASLGPSNLEREINKFINIVNLAQNNGQVDPRIEIVNGSIPGTDIKDLISNTTFSFGNNNPATFWSHIEDLFPSSIKPEQVQIVIFKYIRRRVPLHSSMLGSFDEYVSKNRTYYELALQVLKNRFPNLKMAYMIPLSYKGYVCDSNTIAEPYGYWSGYAVREVITDQIENSVLGTHPGLEYQAPNNVVPWIGWGPYIWSNGEIHNGSGLNWVCPDDYADNIHPSFTGSNKVASLFFQFFYSDPITQNWFRNSGFTSIDCIGKTYPNDIRKKTNHEASSNNIRIFPNPASSSISISLTNDEQEYSFSLYDIAGKTILTQIVKPNAPISIEAVSSGAYYYLLKTPMSEIASSGKIMIQ